MATVSGEGSQEAIGEKIREIVLAKAGEKGLLRREGAVIRERGM
ncbi:MAG: hypothetical protein ABIB61_01365 [Candidatus Shapirobacteria bacterium]